MLLFSLTWKGQNHIKHTNWEHHLVDCHKFTSVLNGDQTELNFMLFFDTKALKSTLERLCLMAKLLIPHLCGTSLSSISFHTVTNLWPLIGIFPSEVNVAV